MVFSRAFKSSPTFKGMGRNVTPSGRGPSRRLGDEISMDSLRMWDHGTIGASLDKDVYRKELGDVMETYAAVARRICGE